MKGSASPFSALVGTMLVLAFATGAARAHIGDQYDSIHFNSGKPDFGTPPRRSIIWWRGETSTRNGNPFGLGGVLTGDYHEELTGEKDEKRTEEREASRKRLRSKAQAAVASGDWKRARALFLQEATTFGWTGNLRDRMEILSDAARSKSVSPRLSLTLQRYLTALALLDTKPEEVQDRDWGLSVKKTILLFDYLYQDTSAPTLIRAHALYQTASAALANGDYPEAQRRYQTYLATFPNIKREAALIMAARAAVLPNDPHIQRLEQGHQALAQLLTEFPHTHFRSAALGLRARIDYLQGQYPRAMQTYNALGDLTSLKWVRRKLPQSPLRDRLDATLLGGYLHRLDRADSYDSYQRNIAEIDGVLRVMSPAGAKIFVRHLLTDTTLPAPYFYYRLYHCDNKLSDLRNLARLADRISGDEGENAARLLRIVQVRLAEVYYQIHDYNRAILWANRAASQDSGTDMTPGRDRALYMIGASRLKQRRYAASHAAFMELLADYPNSSLRPAVREELALVDESMGDLESALQQYFYLGYKTDIAFFLDARMSPKEIKAFLRVHPNHPQRALIAYSLGIRYLRREEFAAARHWLQQIPPKLYYTFSQGRHSDDAYTNPFDNGSPDPLTVLDRLVTLHQAIADAPNTAARAAAEYQYAGYYYKKGTLLLYNAALWEGERADNFAFWWNTSHATPEDDAAARTHMYEHESYARTQQICEDIARRYPNTPTAPLALYRAACCARKLADFNGWWRDDNKRVDHWREASRLMKQLARRYPKHPLAPHARKYAWVFYDEGQDWRRYQSL